MFLINVQSKCFGKHYQLKNEMQNATFFKPHVTANIPIPHNVINFYMHYANKSER